MATLVTAAKRHRRTLVVPVPVETVAPAAVVILGMRSFVLVPVDGLATSVKYHPIRALPDRVRTEGYALQVAFSIPICAFVSTDGKTQTAPHRLILATRTRARMAENVTLGHISRSIRVSAMTDGEDQIAMCHRPTRVIHRLA